MIRQKWESSPVVRVLAFFLPLLAWLVLHRWGNIAPSGDNGLYAQWVGYHFDYISKGVFPLWDPFRSWGWPNLTDPRFFGECNPLYLIIPLLTAWHIPPAVAFNVFLCLLYLTGSIGFYLLVRLLWEDEYAALPAHAMFVVSMLGPLLFAQLALPLILFSSIWFFYFLVAFYRSGSAEDQVRSFTGLVFILMIVVVTYLPFFFFIVVCALVLAIFLIRPVTFLVFIQKIIAFARTFPARFCIGAGVFLLACVPGVVWLMSTSSGNVVFLTARNGFGAVADRLGVPLKMIETSSLASQTSFGEFFADQDLVMNTYCYIPVFPLILLSLGLFTRMDKSKRIVFLMAFFIFLFALGGVTPVHAFLYKHLAFVRMFRNLYLFGPFLFSLLLVCAAAQLPFLLKMISDGPWRRKNLICFLCVHLAWFGWFWAQERVLWSSYATVAGSAVFFTFYFLNLSGKMKGVLLIGLIVVGMLQPAQIIERYWRVWGVGGVSIEPAAEGSFSYSRPLRGEKADMEQGWGLTPKLKKDESGFLKEGFYGTRDSARLFLNVPPEDLQRYVSHKFMLYDQVVYMDGKAPDWGRVRSTLGGLRGPALVFDKRAVQANAGVFSGRNPVSVSGPSANLQVVAFEPNRVELKTNFTHPVFLVFNDSFYSGWRVKVNGRRTPLYQANVAFKGVWVEAGPAKVAFSFLGFPYYAFRWALMGVFLVWGVYLVWLMRRGGACAVSR